MKRVNLGMKQRDGWYVIISRMAGGVVVEDWRGI